MLPSAVDCVLRRSLSSCTFHEGVTEPSFGVREAEVPLESPERIEKGDGEALEGSDPGRRCSVEAMIFISYMAERPVLKLPRRCKKPLEDISEVGDCAGVEPVGEPM